MPAENDFGRRIEIARRHIKGRGVEIGAGTSPVDHDGIDELVLIDRRNQAELEALFGTSIPYRVEGLERALGDPLRFDFVMAHHVIEHCSDPIGQIMTWLPLLRDDGVVFFSIPSDGNVGEKLRVPAPISHVLDDYLFGRRGDDFESKQHLPHFVLNWTSLSETSFWYAREGVQRFSDAVLSEVRRDGHDFHWHVVTLEVFCQIIEAAFWFAGFGVKWVHRETEFGAHYVVAQRAPKGSRPACLDAATARLVQALALIEA
jgi:SAM-dependent methyltransferase